MLLLEPWMRLILLSDHLLFWLCLASGLTVWENHIHALIVDCIIVLVFSDQEQFEKGASWIMEVSLRE